jgi:hypothetical protein
MPKSVRNMAKYVDNETNVMRENAHIYRKSHSINFSSLFYAFARSFFFNIAYHKYSCRPALSFQIK